MRAAVVALLFLACSCVVADEADEDDSPRFQAPECSGGTCRCYDEDGNVIEESKDLKSCGCIYDRFDARRTMVIGNYIPQCDGDGTYQFFQCVNSEGKCYCADDDGDYLKFAEEPDQCK